MSKIDPAASLGGLVAERPSRAALFERLRLDYCCDGRRTLAEACKERGLDSETVRAMLQAIDELSDDEQSENEQSDWRERSLRELCRHIVETHHEGLRRELPHIEELMATVVRVHGPYHPELGEMQSRFDAIHAQLEPHMANEEARLFPAIVALEQGGKAIPAELVDALEDDHTRVGEDLQELCELSGGYNTARARCATHRALLAALADFERDLHTHIHEENNVLLVRARELSAHATAGPREAGGVQ